eukprot:259079-Amphidinium_carterae.1
MLNMCSLEGSSKESIRLQALPVVFIISGCMQVGFVFWQVSETQLRVHCWSLARSLVALRVTLMNQLQVWFSYAQG